MGSLDSASQVSHRLLHWNVSPDLEKEMVVFASKHVLLILVSAMRMKSRARLAQELAACFGVREKNSFTGEAFEALFHATMKVSSIGSRVSFYPRKRGSVPLLVCSLCLSALNPLGSSGLLYSSGSARINGINA